MWCYERRRKKEESRDKNSPKAFGELKTVLLSGDLKASLRIAAEKSIHKMSSNEDEFLEGI